MRREKESKYNQWWVYVKDGDYYAVPDMYDGIEPKGIGIEIVGNVCFKKKVDAIDYIKFLRSG